MSELPDRQRLRRDHRWAHASMSAYLDGELAPARRARIERHLAECARCRQLRADLRRTLDGLHRLAAPGPRTDALRIADSVRVRLRGLD